MPKDVTLDADVNIHSSQHCHQLQPWLWLVNIMRPKYVVMENIAPPQMEGRQKRIWENFPIEVNDNILEYLTPKELIKFKGVSKKANEFIKENKVLHFNKTLERLDEIIKGFTKGRNNDDENDCKFVPKNRVRFKGSGGKGERGYIVKTTTKFVYILLEMDLYKAEQDLKMVSCSCKKVKHMSPFVGEHTEDVKWELTRWGE